jgi:leader peptidase (prepilin peptidase) / N-methyltransferase
MDLVLATIYVVILLWGGAWGSFLNVVVYRLPAGLSVVRPASRCPSCATPIAWWQNVPVLGWAFIGGRCWTCKTPVSMRYPAVEATMAALALAVARPWVGAWAGGELDPGLAATGALVEQAFVFALVAVALIDADTFMIPDRISLPLPLLGLALAVLVGEPRGVIWQQAAIGAALGGFGALAVQWGYSAISGREGLGTGDVKLLAGLGAWLGPSALAPLLLLASLQGLAFALGQAALGTRLADERGLDSLRHVAMPFGPFLALGGIEWLLLGRQLQPLLASWLAV